MKLYSACAALVLVSACHHDKAAAGPFERAGQHLDHAAEKTGHALKIGAQRTGEGVQKGAQATGKAFKKVGDTLQGQSHGEAP